MADRSPVSSRELNVVLTAIANGCLTADPNGRYWIHARAGGHHPGLTSKRQVRVPVVRQVVDSGRARLDHNGIFRPVAGGVL